MTTIDTLLKTRKHLKRRKPTFTRQDAHKRKETSRTGYRRAKGVHSKMREGRRGYKTMINIGYKSPADVRGFHPSGLAPVLVHTPKDILRINPSIQGAVIASGVGAKKRMAILKASQDASKGTIKILNIKDPQAMISSIEQSLKDRKEATKQRMLRKEQSKKAVPKKLETKIEETPKTKEEEKKEQDKLLTQREV